MDAEAGTGRPVTDDFELDDGVVRVRDGDGARYPITVPVGFRDITFRNALACVYTLYVRYGKMPSVKECFDFHKTIPQATYSALFVVPEFQEALDKRGVRFDPSQGLSLEQQSVLMKLSDVTDTRGLKVKLTELGVPMPRYQAWLKQPLFREMLNKQSEDAYAEFLPAIRSNMIGRAAQGDQRAAELIFAKTGEFVPGSREMQDARAVVLAVVDSVLKRVPDVKVRQEILADIQASVTTFDVLHQRELGGMP